MFSNFFSHISAHNTSQVNFCEWDNEHGYFYEFYNTLSSLAFSLFGLYGLYKNNNGGWKNIIHQLKQLGNNMLIYEYEHNFSQVPINKQRKLAINILYLILIFVGFLSAYFHAVLSEFSHAMDIISISLILSTSKFLLSINPNNNNSNFENLIFGLRYGTELFVYTVIAFTMPSFHILLEFIDGFNLKHLIEKNIQNISTNKKNIYNSTQILNIQIEYNRSSKLFSWGLIAWIIDFFLCDYLGGYHTHWIFHTLIAWMSYLLIDLIKYFYYDNDE